MCVRGEASPRRSSASSRRASQKLICTAGPCQAETAVGRGTLGGVPFGRSRFASPKLVGPSTRRPPCSRSWLRAPPGGGVCAHTGEASRQTRQPAPGRSTPVHFVDAARWLTAAYGLAANFSSAGKFLRRSPCRRNFQVGIVRGAQPRRRRVPPRPAGEAAVSEAERPVSSVEDCPVTCAEDAAPFSVTRPRSIRCR